VKRFPTTCDWSTSTTESKPTKRVTTTTLKVQGAKRTYQPSLELKESLTLNTVTRFPPAAEYLAHCDWLILDFPRFSPTRAETHLLLHLPDADPLLPTAKQNSNSPLGCDDKPDRLLLSRPRSICRHVRTFSQHSQKHAQQGPWCSSVCQQSQRRRR
jgi:hypothetical protein